MQWASMPPPRSRCVAARRPAKPPRVAQTRPAAPSPPLSLAYLLLLPTYCLLCTPARPPRAVQDFDDKIWLPMPVNQTVGYDTSVSCTKKYGYNYYLQIQFVILVFVVFCQVCRWGGSPHSSTQAVAPSRLCATLPELGLPTAGRAGGRGCVCREPWTCGDCAGRWVHRVYHEPLVAQGFQQ